MADELNDCQGEGPEFVERAEIARLQAELNEAREVIGKLTEDMDHRPFDGLNDADAQRHLIEVLIDLATLRRARAFLTKGETDNG